MINFSKVSCYTPSCNHSEFLGMKMHKNGEYVLYEDYEELLNAYRTIIDKMSEVVGDAVFEE